MYTNGLRKSKRPHGRPHGLNVRPRDDRGWRVPMAGSKSRAVYDLMLQGLDSGAIATQTGFTSDIVRQLVWKIKHPGLANAYGTNPTRAKS